MIRLKRISTVITLSVVMCAVINGLSGGQSISPAVSQSIEQPDINIEQPDINYASRPLFFWNEPLKNMDAGQLRSIIQEAKSSGYGGVGVLPYFWPEGYLTEEYFSMYGSMIGECARQGLKVNIYDENGFPSGMLCHQFVRLYPERGQKVLVRNAVRLSGPVSRRLCVKTGKAPFSLMAVVAVNDQTKERIDLSEKITTGEQSVEPSVTSDKTEYIKPVITCSTVFDETGRYTADKAIDGDSDSRWNAGIGKSFDQWLELSFDKPVEFDTVYIDEVFDRVREFRIEVLSDNPVSEGVSDDSSDSSDSWRKIFEGTTIGSQCGFPVPVTRATKVRVWFVKTQNPEFMTSIAELDLIREGSFLINDQTVENRSWIDVNLPEGQWTVWQYRLAPQNDNGFCDYLDSEDVKLFVEHTHQKYFEHFKEHFGKTVDMSFYDEPAMWRGDVWTEKFNEKFEQHYGFSPTGLYPALWDDIGDETYAARVLLFGFRARLFKEGFIDTLADWCHEHGIAFTGHTGEEELLNPTSTVGDLMSVFEKQDYPGLDEVIFYGRIHRAVKVISSAADNWDKGAVMSEIHGATVNISPETMLKSVMDEMTRGVNLFTPHAVWYNHQRVPGGMVPELSSRTPRYANTLNSYNSFIARACKRLRDSRHVADIAILYPIEDLWSGFRFGGVYHRYKGGVVPVATWNYMDLGESLFCRHRKDFTFVHPTVLNERTTVNNGRLIMHNPRNTEHFRTVILPAMEVIDLASARKLKEFHESGGLIIGTRQLPYRGTCTDDGAEVAAIMTELFGLNPLESTGPIMSSSSQREVNWNGEMIGLEPWKAQDGFDDTRWEPENERVSWLEVKFSSSVKFDRVTVEQRNPAIRSAVLEYFDDSKQQWVTVSNTTEDSVSADRDLNGSDHNGIEFKFPAVEASRLRLKITAHEGQIEIREMGVWNGSENLIFPPAHVHQSSPSAGKCVYLPNPNFDLMTEALAAGEFVHDVEIDPTIPRKGGDFTYIHKIKLNSETASETEFWLFANSTDQPVSTTVRLRGRFDNLKTLDPHTGITSTPDFQWNEATGQTLVKLDIQSVHALFVYQEYPNGK